MVACAGAEVEQVKGVLQATTRRAEMAEALAATERKRADDAVKASHAQSIQTENERLRAEGERQRAEEVLRWADEERRIWEGTARARARSKLQPSIERIADALADLTTFLADFGGRDLPTSVRQSISKACAQSFDITPSILVPESLIVLQEAMMMCRLTRRGIRRMSSWRWPGRMSIGKRQRW